MIEFFQIFYSTVQVDILLFLIVHFRVYKSIIIFHVFIMIKILNTI
jgi:hypothetical protein